MTVDDVVVARLLAVIDDAMASAIADVATAMSVDGINADAAGDALADRYLATGRAHIESQLRALLASALPRVEPVNGDPHRMH